MTKIEWSDDLSVGIDLLDNQHRKLISMINVLDDDAMGAEELGEVIFGLLEYAAIHFRDEEKFFVDEAPEIVEHHFASHTIFISTAYKFVQRFKNGEALALRQPVYEFLCQWLVEHILVEDMQYKPGNKNHAAE
ncbi:bacteriohemerythrin [Magnetospirillum aberrantis]|uniref:Hemerythrin family protein n=1 Tax=Magnetospirillum aberrantis SpK TaxID=908842 RepID=A0A7C9QUA1_9PROT|nr:bacteriohemerythrin [Magnetospirillum aberrantis]NFV80744.1 hemerythrin family protein [Magnetospirillum aberrantis SpK]